MRPARLGGIFTLRLIYLASSLYAAHYCWNRLSLQFGNSICPKFLQKT